MATEAIKSAAITSLDASPPVRTDAGKGAPGVLMHVDGTAAMADAVTSGSTYRFVRVPSTARVKSVKACVETAVTTFTVDIGVYYASGGDVPAGITAGAVIDADLFGSAVALAAIIVPTEYVMESTQYSCTEIMQPLWQAAGLSADPGCDIDIVMTNTATNSGAGTAYLSCEFVNLGS